MARNRIVTEIRADSAQMRAEFAKAQRKVGEFSEGVKSATKTVAGFAAGFIGIRAGVGIITDLSEKFDRVGKLSSRFNLPVEEVQKLSIASELTGTNIERMTAALTKATVAGVEASNGLETYSRAFEDLNIDVEAFNQADASEKISILARSFSEAENEAVAFTAAYRILGKSGADLIPLLRENADGIDRLSGNLKTLSEADVKAIENFNDEMSLLKANLQAELAKAFAGSLTEVKDEIVALGQGLVQATAFLIEHKDAIKLLVGAWAAYKGLKVTSSLLSVATGFAKTQLAINAETAAVNKNTAAHAANARARKSGAAAGAAGRGLSAGNVGLALFGGFELFQQVRDGIGSELASPFFNDEKPDPQRVAQRQEELELQRAQFDERERLAQQADVEAQNLRWRNQLLKEGAAEQARIAEKRAESNRALQTELNELAAGVLKVEMGYRTAAEQLDVQREKLSAITEQVREVARNGELSPGEGIDSGATIELAREAAQKGNLQLSKELLQLADLMQQKKAEVLKLEEGIRAESEAQQVAYEARRAQEDAVAASRKEALNEQAQEVTLLKLKAAGRIEEAEALQKEIDLRKEAKRIAMATGLDEEKALNLARQKNLLNEQAQGRPAQLDNRFDEDGNRKLARDGRRRRIVLIRRDSDGNRIDGNAEKNLALSREARASKSNPLISKTDELIEYSKRLADTWSNLQTSS